MTSISMEPAKWFPALQAKKESALTLFCLPHAGGDVINFWDWPRHLPPELEVRCAALPGKYARSSELHLPSFDDAVRALEQTIRPYLGKPYALFGHSMGALLAFELAHRLRQSSTPPLGLFVSGMSAPHEFTSERNSQRMTDQEILEFLRDTDGIPEEMLVAEGAMLAVIAAVRNDLLLCDTYAYSHAQPLDCPTSVFGGREDSFDAESLDAWREVVGPRCRISWFDGGHMFVMTQPREVTNAITSGIIGLARNL